MADFEEHKKVFKKAHAVLKYMQIGKNSKVAYFQSRERLQDLVDQIDAIYAGRFTIIWN